MARKRVIHCGTGQIGLCGLRAILESRDLDLVGLHVWSPEKVGVDAGTLTGLEPTGIVGTTDWQALVDLEADCLTYFGRFNNPGQETAPVDDILPFLARGTNVATIAAFHLGHPQTIPSNIRSKIETTCAQGNSSVYFTGIDPGWATTDLALAALAAADRVDCIRVLELGWWGEYNAEHSMREFFGFGQQPGYEPLLMKDGWLRTLWEPTLRHLADALGVEIDEWKSIYETASLPEDVETSIGVLKAGTATTLHFELQGLHRGKPVVIVEHVDTLVRGATPQWKQPFGPGDLSYRIEIEGEPRFTVEMNFNYRDSLRCCAMPVINAVSAVCDGKAGIMMPHDVLGSRTRNHRNGKRL